MLPIDETLEAHLHRHRVSGGPVYGALVVAVTAAMAALPLVRVDVSVAAAGIIRPADEVATISPDGALLAEVLLPPRDIGHVRVGSPVRLFVDAYDRRQWGSVSGRVAEISADFVTPGGRPGYRVLVELHRPYVMRPNGSRGALMKGMTLEASFSAGEPTLWQLLRNDLDDWLHPFNAPA